MNAHIDFICKTVEEYYNMEPDSIQLETRKREIAQARQIAMYFSRQITKASLSQIGVQIGNKDHATVMHACKTVTNLACYDKKFRSELKEIEKKLNSFKEKGQVEGKPSVLMGKFYLKK